MCNARRVLALLGGLAVLAALSSPVAAQQPVTITSGTVAVTNGGTFATQVDGSALTALQLIDNIVSVEDAVAGSAFSGIGMLAVRQDSHSDLAADGDFIPLTVDADGGLRVTIVAGAGSGGTALADDADFSAGSTSFTPSGGFYQSGTPTACTDGDTCAFSITVGRALKVAIANSDGTLATVASDMTIGSAFGTTGPGIVASYKDFDGAALPTTTNVGTEEEATPLAASIKGVLYTMEVSEDGALAAYVSHDSADSGYLIGLGARATTSVSGQTEVANADRVAAVAGIDGVTIVRPHSNIEDIVKAVVGVTDGSSTSLVASQGAGLKFCATTLIVSNSSATNVTVDIRDGTAGSVIATIPAAANMGGAAIPLQTPLCTSDATAMAMDPSAAASTVTVTAIGFKTDL